MANNELTELEAESTSKLMYINICRICLNPGEIPICGDDHENPDIMSDVITFSSVDISYDDELPQHICSFCHELLKGAILFRNTAQESDFKIKSNNFFMKVEYLHIDEEDLKSETSFSNYCMPDYSSESGELKIAEDESVDTNTAEKKFERRENDYEKNDSEMIMIVVPDTENSETEITSKNSTKIVDSSCEICKVDFETSNDYYQHMGTVEHIKNIKLNQKIQCSMCEKLIGKEHYVSHMIKHSIEPITIASGMYKCKICDKILLSEQDMKIHKNCETHKMSIRNAHQFECPVCYSNVNKNDLKLHIKSHVSELGRKQKCPVCNKYFDHTYYNSHLKRMHNKDCKNELSPADRQTEVNLSKMRYVCDKCGKVFTNSFSFKLHCQTHGGELKYKCMFCPYRGLHQGLLKIHVRTHTGDYNYKCQQCTARFITKSNLNKHMMITHVGPINFKCATCNKGFYTQLSLERHNDVDHLGIRNHVCDICGKAFGYRNNMMNHQLKVHKRERLTEGKGRLPNYLVSR